MKREDFEKAIKDAYMEGYEDGNTDGSNTSGCRGCYDPDPRYEPQICWDQSQTLSDLDTTWEDLNEESD